MTLQEACIAEYNERAAAFEAMADRLAAADEHEGAQVARNEAKRHEALAGLVKRLDRIV